MSFPCYSRWMVVFCTLVGCGFNPQRGDNRVKAFVTRDPLWGREPTIPVCLESAEGVELERWNMLKSVLQSEYNARTPVKFMGFLPCPDNASQFVRVTIADERPRVGNSRHFGPEALGKKGAVVMNLTFKNYRPDICSSSHQIERCIHSYALHEFGHLLGLMHEHARADNTCSSLGDSFRGLGDFWSTTWGTNYDPNSVMSYCMNARQMTEDIPIVLSEGDVSILTRMYGKQAPLPRHLEDLEDSLRGKGSFTAVKEIAKKKPHLAFAELRHQSDFHEGKSIVHETYFTMMKSLIRESGFTVVAFELPWRQMESLNDFVHGKKESIGVTLSAFHTPELIEFLHWLREYNKTSVQKVDVTGFDVQHQGKQDLEFILKSLQDAGLLDERAKNAFAAACAEGNPNKEACIQTIQAWQEKFSTAPFPDKMMRDFVELAFASRLVEEQLKTISGLEEYRKAFNARDRAMAQAYLTLYRHRFSGRRILSFGAFLHMAKATPEMETPLGEVTSLGTHLSQALGSDYGVIGNLAQAYTLQVEVAQRQADGTLTVSRPIITIESEITPAIRSLTLANRFLLFATLTGDAGSVPTALAQRQRFLAVPNVADIKRDPGAVKDGVLVSDITTQLATIVATQKSQNYVMSLPQQLDGVVYFYRDGKH